MMKIFLLFLISTMLLAQGKESKKDDVFNQDPANSDEVKKAKEFEELERKKFVFIQTFANKPNNRYALHMNLGIDKLTEDHLDIKTVTQSGLSPQLDFYIQLLSGDSYLFQTKLGFGTSFSDKDLGPSIDLHQKLIFLNEDKPDFNQFVFLKYQTFSHLTRPTGVNQRVDDIAIILGLGLGLLGELWGDLVETSVSLGYSPAYKADGPGISLSGSGVETVFKFEWWTSKSYSLNLELSYSKFEKNSLELQRFRSFVGLGIYF